MKWLKRILSASAGALLLAISQSATAAGPLLLCDTGQPFLWPNGGANVPYNPDQGNLGILSNAQATQAVDDSYQAWADVPTATISYSNQGALPVDVDVTNFGPFLEPVAPDGLSAIVFDDTGEIFDLLFGAGSGVLGFASPEWVNPTECTILEGFSFLNGPAIGTLEGLLNLMVHEFGHYSNLAHTEVNGQLFIGVGDSSGPGADNTFGFPPNPDGGEVIETMYPFLFSNIDQLSRTPHADDQSSLSQLYPEPDYASTTGTIAGTILFGNTKVTGVNIIARNVDDPFFDAVSAISSDFTDDFSQGNPFTGTYRITGLTPGANYAVYIDEILAGGFSTTLASPLPGPEEFYNGANESSDPTIDIVNEFEAVQTAAGVPNEDIDILFNLPAPGDPLPTGDDGSVEIPLPFEFCAAGKGYNSAFINGNGFLTLGTPAGGLTFIESVAGMINGPPRIAGLWADFSPNIAGSVFYEQTENSFTVTWDQVPEFFAGGSNTFSITLKNNSAACDGQRYPRRSFFAKDVILDYGDLTATNGISGVSAGSFATSGFEEETDLSNRHFLSLLFNAAVFEQFDENDFDLANDNLRFRRVGNAYFDRFEHNDSLDRARKIRLPFDSTNTFFNYTGLSPEAADIDFYRFKKKLKAGTTLVADIINGQVDTVLGLYRCDDSGYGHHGWSRRCDPDTAELVAFNDDSNGLLSSIVYEVPEDGTYVLAVTFCCDYDFDGVDPGQGEPFDEGRYVLSVQVIEGILLSLSDESFVEVDLGFNFNFQGTDYSSVFVNSNGYLTFGAGETFNFSPSVGDMESGLPRVAPLWADYDPGSGGLVVSNVDGGSATFDFLNVPEFFVGGSSTFSMTLNADGSVQFDYDGLTATSGITGIGAGDGAPGAAVDFSSGGPFSATGTTYEEFINGLNDIDLSGSAINIDP